MKETAFANSTEEISDCYLRSFTGTYLTNTGGFLRGVTNDASSAGLLAPFVLIQLHLCGTEPRSIESFSFWISIRFRVLK